MLLNVHDVEKLPSFVGGGGDLKPGAGMTGEHAPAARHLLEGHLGGAFNLGTGNGFSVREILEAIALETGRSVPHLIKPRRAGDPAYLVADASAAREVLQFSPRHSDLATIIRTAWAWHLKAHPLKAV
jgi:UDP-glucose 4-epimerase